MAFFVFSLKSICLFVNFFIFVLLDNFRIFFAQLFNFRIILTKIRKFEAYFQYIAIQK